jgi:hypothetical protein
MLLQVIIGVSLETLKDFCVGSLHRGIADFYAKIFLVPLECIAGEMEPVVSDDPVWDPKPIDDGLDKLDCGLVIDLDHRGRFRPFGESVDGNIEISVLSDGPGKWP